MKFVLRVPIVRRLLAVLFTALLSIFSACGGSGSSEPAPVVITSQPVSTSVATGTEASFSVSAVGDGLSYQWQRSTDSAATWAPVAAATAATYDIAATAPAMSGDQYRVVVMGTAGSVTSSAATLTVTSLPGAPTIVSNPVDVSVLLGANVSFSVTATGAALAYRWQSSVDGVLWASVSGATGPTLTLTAVALADNGRRFRVVVVNAFGTVTSIAARLTVMTAATPLAGRVWVAGQALETNDNEVLVHDARIDDAGAVTVLFVKSDGNRKVLYATRGTPQPAGNAPSFSAPVPIDSAAPIDENAIFQYRMGVAPGGNVVVTWTHIAACNSTSYSTSGSCTYRYVARYLGANANWEAPILVGSDPSLLFEPPVINDLGDVMVNSQSGWIRSGSGGYTLVPAVMWRSASQGAFRQQSFENSVSSLRRFMDNAGHLLVVASATQNATTDIVAYRGNVDDGLGIQEVLDARLSTAILAGVWAGTNGQAVVFWLQNDGTSLTGTAAAIDAPAGAWSFAQVPSIYDYYVANSPNAGAVVTDGGDFILYTEGGRLRRTGGVWSAREPFTAISFNINSIRSSLNRDGSVLQVRLADNAWSTFDGPTSQVVSAFPPLATGRPTGPEYVYGVSAGDDGLVLLSKSGVGAKVTRNTYDILPTPALPAGDGRSVFNLWGLYFK